MFNKERKMKVVWLINGILPDIAKNENMHSGSDIGWISSVLEEIQYNENLELFIIFPQKKKDKIIEGRLSGFYYYGFFQNMKYSWEQSNYVQKQFEEIIKQINPDLIQIWGSEYAHSLDMVEVIGGEYKTVVHIQGLVSVYEKQFLADVPLSICYSTTFRDIVRKGNIIQEKKKFALRGKNERILIEKSNYVMGRTDWDLAHSKAINSNIKYFHCKESMRKAFFKEQWSYDNMIPRTIFVTQGNYPVKGFHYLLGALAILANKYPNIKVRVAGENIVLSVKDRIRESTYGRYIRKLICKYHLEKVIEFVGVQDVEGMIREYKNANVFVLPSAIENSPNSLAEAMVLGVPCVAADVGGVSSMVTNKKEALIYQHNDPVMLAYYIEMLFEDKKMCAEISENARKRALKDYSATNNKRKLFEIYQEILKD